MSDSISETQPWYHPLSPSLPPSLPLSPPSVSDNATTTLINVLTTNAHIVLEWSPPPLSEPLEGDLPSNSEFSIDKYILLKDDKTIVTLDSTMTNYIYTVEDDEGETYFRIRTNYSDALINGLNPETNITVDIPTAEGEWRTCINCVCV